MEYDAIITDSLEYAKEALNGKWVRWITFMILALPFALVQFLFDPEKLMSKTTGMINWELVPWDQLAVLIAIGIFFGFFLAGYTVRIFRGAKPAPEFDNWAGLFVDGLKLTIVWLLWMLPFMLTLVAFIGVILFAYISKDTFMSPVLLLGILALLFVAAVVFAVIASLYSYLGSVRFARTGSIREGIRFSKITEMIRIIGWTSYIVALLVLCVLSCIFGVLTSILSMIPFIGWVLILIINPFFTVMFARYAVLVYEQGENPPAAAVQP